MLQDIRDNSQGWIAKTIIGIIMVLLALTGLNSFFTSRNHTDEVATVNGDSISRAEFEKTKQIQKARLAQRLGSSFDAASLDDKIFSESAMQELIQQQLLLQEATRSGFSITDKELDQVILHTPEFAINGKFNTTQFDQVIQRLGYSRLQFRQRLHDDLLAAQLRSGLLDSNFVTDTETNQAFKLQKQKRSFSIITIKADPDAIQISNQEAQTYYKNHLKEFKSKEKIVLDYIELDKNSFLDKVSVKDSQLKSAYQAQIGQLKERRDAAHIFIAVNKDVNDAEAKKKIDSIYQRIENKELFSKLAKELSDDKGSSNKGGELGYAEPNTYDPAFEKVLYTLKEDEISKPVRDTQGWHIIKLLGIQQPNIPEYASLKDKLEKELKKQKVEQLYVDARRKLEDVSFEASDLSQPSDDLGLKIQTTQPFGREGKKSGLLANVKVLKAAFSTDVLEQELNSNLIEFDPNTAVVLHIRKHYKPKQMNFVTVEDKIKQKIARIKAANLAKETGELKLKSLESNENLKEAHWAFTENAKRNQKDIDPQIIRTVFQTPHPKPDQPTYNSLSLNNGDFTIIRLQSVSMNAKRPTGDDKIAYNHRINAEIKNQTFSAFIKRLKDSAEIKQFSH